MTLKDTIANRIQQLCNDRRSKRTGSGEISLFGGLVYCLDCGFTMRYQQEQHRRKSGDLVVYKSYMCGKAACSSHIIYTNRLSEIVIADIRQKAAMLDCDEQELSKRVAQQKATAAQEQLTMLQGEKPVPQTIAMPNWNG